MGSKSFTFKLMQWFIRLIQACCAIVVLAIVCYFMGTQDNRELPIHTWERAVAGIAGAALVYCLLQVALLCCLAGYPLTSLFSMLIDLAFIGGFMYIAWANRNGASSCSGDSVETPYGTGKDEWKIAEHVGGNDGWTRLPTFKVACNMQRACLAVAIIGIFFFLFSMFNEWKMMKNRKADNVMSTGLPTTGRKGLFGFRHKRANADTLPQTVPQHGVEKVGV